MTPAPANVAIEGSNLVLCDWSLATAGPPEVEGEWLANFAQFYRFSIDEVMQLCGRKIAPLGLAQMTR